MRRNYFFSRNRDALLEPCDGKLSRTVLRGESPRKGADLLDKVILLDLLSHKSMKEGRSLFLHFFIVLSDKRIFSKVLIFFIQSNI